MLQSEDIKFGNVYRSESGETRLVTSVSNSVGKQPVVIWRTASPTLQATQKSHGSCTVLSFRKWAVSFVPAKKEDWEAFAAATRHREHRNADKKAISRYRKAMRAETNKT